MLFSSFASFVFLWYFFIAIYPVKIYDFFRADKKRILDGLSLIFWAIVLAPTLHRTLTGEYLASPEERQLHWIWWGLLSVVYLYTLYEAITQRTRRNFITLGLHTLALCWVAWHCFA